jgi:hypothetical protein
MTHHPTSPQPPATPTVSLYAGTTLRAVALTTPTVSTQAVL